MGMEELDTGLHSILLAICTALGKKVKDEYLLTEDTLECLTDLKRILREDYQSTEKLIYLKLGEWQIVKNNFVPLIHHHSKNVELMKSVCILF